MGKASNAALALGALAVIGVGSYFIITKAKGQQGGGPGSYILQIAASEGGTTNPAPSPSGISEPAGTVVTITFTPNSGYTIGSILLDGVQIGNSPSIQVTMDSSHSLIVTFYKGGQPPPSTPYAIIAPNSTVITGYYGCKVELAGLDAINKTIIQFTDQNWRMGNIYFAGYPLTFKVIDANGTGVPNVPLILYPDMFPDASKYHGYITLENQAASASNPITVDHLGNPIKTNANGEFTVYVSYFYGINILKDNYLTLSKDAGLHVDGIVVLVPESFTPYDGWNGTWNGIPLFYTGKGGDKIIPSVPTLNNIVAQIPGTAIPAAKALVYCQFHAKML